MQFRKNIKDLADSYQYFIFDIWGVIHDGESAYDDALEAINSLKNKGKKICFLSNAPRRVVNVEVALEKFGITSDLYEFILTSGELAFLNLKENQNLNFKDFGNKYFYIGPDKDIDLLKGLNYDMIEDLSKSDFMLVTGFDDIDSVLDEKLPIIKEAIKYNIPLICPNPDLIVVRKDGFEMICAGLLAEKYLEMGGKVHYYGKPYKDVYDKVYELFCKREGAILDKKDFLAVGDSLENDVKGANNFKIDSALVTSGILCNRLDVKYGQVANKNKLEEICNEHNVFPKFVIPNI